MRIRNFYRSRSDLDKMQGVRQFLVPIVTKFYNGEVDGAMRIKESSLPLQTLFNAVDTILARLEDTENPELLVGDIWDSLVMRSRKSCVEQRLVHFFDFNYYDYRVNRKPEATLIFGAVYYMMTAESPEKRFCLKAIKDKALYGTEAIPYFNLFEKTPASGGNIKDHDVPVSHDPRQDVILELKMRTEKAMNDLSISKAHEGYVSIDAMLYVAECYFRRDAASILNALEYVVSQTNGSDLDRIRSKRKALLQAGAGRPANEPDVDTGMTTGQQVLFFYYIFDSLGLNFHNSDKAAWIRLLHSVTGRNRDNIKHRLNFRFEEEQTQKDLRYVASCLRELFPSISSKIERDSRIQ